ncbi:hypothetical protein AVEN_213339-1, partial [Araneus ventricosus]
TQQRPTRDPVDFFTHLCLQQQQQTINLTKVSSITNVPLPGVRLLRKAMGPKKLRLLESEQHCSKPENV